MTLKKWIKPIETSGIKCKIYMNYKSNVFEADCMYSGSMHDIPYYLVDYQIGYCVGDPEVEWEPIFWALLDKESNTYGFVINLREDGEK